LAQARGNVLRLDEARRWMTDPALPLHSYDTVVSVFQFCGVDDVYSACLRIAELLRPAGQLLVLEHVRSTGWRGRIQDAAARLPATCRQNRDVVGLLRQNGFAVTDCDRFVLDGATPLARHAVSAVAIRKVRNEVGS
jgi:hypothetical protein